MGAGLCSLDLNQSFQDIDDGFLRENDKLKYILEYNAKRLTVFHIWNKEIRDTAKNKPWFVEEKK